MPQTLTCRSGSLTPAQVAAFQRDGFVIARVFDPDDFLAVQQEISAWIDDRARALHAEGLLCDLHEEAPFSTRFGLLAAQCDEMHGGMDITDLLGDAHFTLMRHPRMLDAVESLIGEEIALNPIHHLRAKPPAEAGRRQGFYEVPWHQDSGVTTPDSDAGLLVTAWTPLGGASEEMGCMHLIPGFHRQGHVRHIHDPAYGTTIDPVLVPADGHVVGACKPGEVVFMSQFTPHCSTSNRSHVCRWSLDLRYQAIGAPSGRAWYPSTPLRSQREPASVVTDPAIWRATWQEALARPNPGVRHRIG